MKILLCVLYYEPAWAYGGPPRVASDIARALSSHGHSVTVCTTDALDRRRRIREREEISGGVRVLRFPNLSNTLAFHSKIFLPVGMKRWLARNIDEFDVVHLFDARTLQNAWAAREASVRRIPFFLSVWGSLPRGTGWRALIKARYDRVHLRKHLDLAHTLLAQNDHEAQLYKEYGADPERVRLWPLGVNPAIIENSPAKGAFRIKHGIPAEDPVVLFVGRIHGLKGLGPLLRIFAHTQRSVPSARLVVVGRDDGFVPQMQMLARELGIESRFHFVGPLYGADVLPAYVDADLFCLTPEHFEETSLAALTACACGAPVLLNDRCGIPWLDEYDAGRCLPHDEERLAAEMTNLLRDPQRRCEMGSRARKMIEERFLLPRIVDQIEKIYAEAIGSRL